MPEPIVHRNVAVLKVTNPSVIEEIRALIPLDDFVLAVLSDTELVVDPARIGELSSLLADRELTPLMKRARVHARPGEWDDEVTQPKADLFK